jgi:hypothetical protein
MLQKDCIQQHHNECGCCLFYSACMQLSGAVDDTGADAAMYTGEDECPPLVSAVFSVDLAELLPLQFVELPDCLNEAEQEPNSDEQQASSSADAAQLQQVRYTLADKLICLFAIRLSGHAPAHALRHIVVNLFS